MDSILAQTFFDFEFVIVDDGSTDDTDNILHSYTDSRIIMLKNEESIGLTRSLNLGLNKTQGEYIARMDADDISLSHRLTAQVCFLDQNPQVGVVGTAACLIDPNNTLGQIVQYPEYHDVLQWIMCFFENPIIHPSVMFRSSLVKSLGGYNETYQTSQDYELWHRALKITQLANVQDVCLQLRKHEDNISQTRYSQQQNASLEISAAIMSDIMKQNVPPQKLQRYCKFIWSGEKVPRHEVLDIGKIVFKLSKIVLSNSQTVEYVRHWISMDAIKKLKSLTLEVKLSLFDRVMFNYFLRVLSKTLKEF
jgi:glycosyltransferase involved in cell wall biosynthesis